MKNISKKIYSMLAIATLAISTMIVMPVPAKADSLKVEICGTACAFGVCVTVCVSVEIS